MFDSILHNIDWLCLICLYTNQSESMTEDLSSITTTDNNLAIICSNTSIPPLQYIYFFGGGIKLWLRSQHIILTEHERHIAHLAMCVWRQTDGSDLLNLLTWYLKYPKLFWCGSSFIPGIKTWSASYIYLAEVWPLSESELCLVSTRRRALSLWLFIPF